MAHPQNLQLQKFYRSIHGKNLQPVEPGSDFYVPLLEEHPEKDPILKIVQQLLWADDESVFFLTGYRGNGKSTQLRRLKQLLDDQGYTVFLVDMLKYVHMSEPLEITDFLLSLAAGLTAQVEAFWKSKRLDERAIQKLKTLVADYWKRIKNFLGAEVNVEPVEFSTGEVLPFSASMGLQLAMNATFKQKLQEYTKGKVTELVRDIHDYVAGLVAALHGLSEDPNHKVVLLLDSLEQLRGWGEQGERVYQSLASLFSENAVHLTLPSLHVVYTIPPYLPVLSPNLGNHFGGQSLISWPNVHVRTPDGAADPAGLTIMRTLIDKRYDQWSLFLKEAQLNRAASDTGGDIRDYFRLIRESITFLALSQNSSVTDEMLLRATEQLRNEMALLPDDHLEWLRQVHKTHTIATPSDKELSRLVRFMDTNAVMNYLNGKPWFDVHPLILPRLGI